MSSSSLLSSLATLGLGYSIAIALGFLVLFASLLLASYFCFRRGAGGGAHFNGVLSPTSSSSHLSFTVPRVLFVAEGSESPDAYSSAAAATSSPVGLDPVAIASYPKVRFSSAGADADAMCSICLSEYTDGEMLRVMPDCRHKFHVVCLDAWLRRNASCPVCRSSPIPSPVATPLATPLSELVPLSQYAADRRRSRYLTLSLSYESESLPDSRIVTCSHWKEQRSARSASNQRALVHQEGGGHYHAVELGGDVGDSSYKDTSVLLVCYHIHQLLLPEYASASSITWSERGSCWHESTRGWNGRQDHGRLPVSVCSVPCMAAAVVKVNW